MQNFASQFKSIAREKFRTFSLKVANSGPNLTFLGTQRNITTSWSSGNAFISEAAPLQRLFQTSFVALVQ